MVERERNNSPQHFYSILCIFYIRESCREQKQGKISREAREGSESLVGITCSEIRILEKTTSLVCRLFLLFLFCIDYLLFHLGMVEIYYAGCAIIFLKKFYT